MTGQASSILFSGRFEAELFEWRGPAPYLFAAVPDPLIGELSFAARQVSYGWGMIPAIVTVGDTAFRTALFPRDGSYVVPIKVAMQRLCGARPGMRLAIELTIPDRR